MGALWEKSLKCLQNEDFLMVYAIAVQDPSGNVQLATPYNFAGAAAKMQVHQGALTTSTLLLTLTSGAGITFGTTTYLGTTYGTITIAMTHLQTLALPAGTWNWDLFVYIGSPTQNICFFQGPFEVAATGTR